MLILASDVLVRIVAVKIWFIAVLRKKPLDVLWQPKKDLELASSVCSYVYSRMRIFYEL